MSSMKRSKTISNKNYSISSSGKGDCLLDKPKRNFLDVINMRGVTEAQISRNYESLLKTKSISDRRLLNMMRNSRIERERRDHRSSYLIPKHNEINRNPHPLETAFDRNKQNLMPGAYFNMDLQCQLIFGPESRVCPYMTPCRRLWCTSGSAPSLGSSLETERWSNDHHPYGQFKRRQEKLAAYKVTDAGCKTQHIPWADGSPCSNSTDEEHFCVKGECVSRRTYVENSSIVNGGWSDWSKWTECSRVCGGGVRSSFRVSFLNKICFKIKSAYVRQPTFISSHKPIRIVIIRSPGMVALTVWVSVSVSRAVRFIGAQSQPWTFERNSAPSSTTKNSKICPAMSPGCRIRLEIPLRIRANSTAEWSQRAPTFCSRTKL